MRTVCCGPCGAAVQCNAYYDNASDVKVATRGVVPYRAAPQRNATQRNAQEKTFTTYGAEFTLDAP